MNYKNITNENPFTLIAGPCQIETPEHAYIMASRIKEITTRLDIPFVYKSSFDKANRTSINGKRGLGLEAGLKVFEDLKRRLDVPITTDVHLPEHCNQVKDVVDIIQIPAFLCRQTDLLIEAGKTDKIINVKKGQFLAPWDMKNVAEKIASTGNKKIILTERGASFGYNTLVTDMRSLYEMKKTGYPVCIDVTHSCQQPGGNGTSSGGNREHIPVIAQSSVAVGVGVVFMEVHNDPNNAYSDGPNNLYLHDLEKLLLKLKALDQISKSV